MTAFGSRSARTGNSHLSVASDWAVAVIPEARRGSSNDSDPNHATCSAVTPGHAASSQSMHPLQACPLHLPRRRLTVATVVAAVLAVPHALVGGQQLCKAAPAAHQAIERGWTAYRANDIATATSEFKHALTLCPRDPAALTGAGYGAMRQNELANARSLFARALAVDSTSYDAAAGAGMSAFRAGDMAGARRSFERVLRIVPHDSTALSYIARISGGSTATVLARRDRPAVTSIAARTGRRVIETPDGKGGWTPMWIKAVNLGAALPGKFPSEFPPNDSTYDRWIALVAGMRANAIRVYTIHPPHFYAALRRWNLAHPANPVWLIHG